MGNPWTPGPWKVNCTGWEGQVDIDAEDNPLPTRAWVNKGPVNLRLIAAAPEMAEALECVLVDMQCGDGTMTLATTNKVASILARIKGDPV